MRTSRLGLPVFALCFIALQEEQLLDKQLRTVRESNRRLKDLYVQLDTALGAGDPPGAGGSMVGPQRDSLPANVSSPAALSATTRGSPLRGTVFSSGNEDGACVAGQQRTNDAVAAVVTVTFDRTDYLKRHLTSVLSIHGRDPSNLVKFPLYVSQDGKEPHAGVRDLVQSFVDRGVSYLHHKEEAEPIRLLNKKENLAYYRIANHYKFILHTFFDCFGYDALIILEDDMELAPDFFGFFEATALLLKTDPTLYCVSSWNDHGQKKFVSDPRQLYRSDFFPGLGWMLTRELWHEVSAEWPKAYWDDWVRLQKVRKGRQCIRPEVCRTYNFGAKGSSKGFYYKRYLEPIRLNDVEVDWAREDTSYLQADRYDMQLNATLEAAPVAASVEEAKVATGDVRLLYDSQEHYEALTARLGMLREWKDSIPRGAYRGIVVVRFEAARIFLVPSPAFVPPVLDATQPVKIDHTGAVVRRKLRPVVMKNGHPLAQAHAVL